MNNYGCDNTTISASIRHPELDLAKGLGIVFMVLVHVFLEYYPYESGNTAFIKTIFFLGRFPAAPLFMFCLGIGVHLSRHNSALELLRRGIRILIIAYLLVNFTNNLVPPILLALIDGTFSVSYLRSLLMCIPDLLYIDILQFASLTFLFFSIFKRFLWKDWYLASFVIAVSVLGQFLRTAAPINSTLWCAITGLFWGSSASSYFPFASWIIFPCAGYLFCKYLLTSCKSKDRMYCILGTVGLCGYILLSYISITLDISFANFGELCEPSDYYHMTLWGNMGVLAFLMAWIALCYALVKVLPTWINKVFQQLSKHITPIYVLHYFLLRCTSLILHADSSLSAYEVLICTGIILFLSETIYIIFEKIQHTRQCLC